MVSTAAKKVMKGVSMPKNQVKTHPVSVRSYKSSKVPNTTIPSHNRGKQGTGS